VFPCFDDIVGGVPALGCPLALGGLEHPADSLAVAGGIEAPNRHSPSPRLLAEHRAAR
jgi:hypothetical protein